MEWLGVTAWVSLAVCCVAVLVDIKKCFAMLVVVAPLTTVAMLNVADSSIHLYQLIWLIYTIKFIKAIATHEMAMPRLTFAPFVLVALATVPLAYFANDLVINPDGLYEPVKASFQQITQLIYLLMAVSTSWYTSAMLKSNKISLDGLINLLGIGLVPVLMVCLLQLFVAPIYITEYFRNTAHAIYVDSNYRITSTFLEPSMLSLYLVPMLGFAVPRILKKKERPLAATTVVIILLICLQNNSSSALVGLGVILVLVLINRLIQLVRLDAKNRRKKILILASFAVAIVFMGSLVFGNQIHELLLKLEGTGVSGSTRRFNAALTWGVFLNNPILGVGWGTIRCESTLLTWLAEIGLVGTALFLIPGIRIVGNLISANRSDLPTNRGVAYAIISATAILFISVPEPYYFTYWIFLGLAEVLGGSGQKNWQHKRKVLLLGGVKSEVKCGVMDYTLRLFEALKDDGQEISVLASGQFKKTYDRGFIYGSSDCWGSTHELLRLIRSCGNQNELIIHIQYPAKAYGRHLSINILPVILKTMGYTTVLTVHEFSDMSFLARLRMLPNILLADALVFVDQNEYMNFKQKLRFRRKCLLIPIASNINKSSLSPIEKKALRNEMANNGEKLICHFGFINRGKYTLELVKGIYIAMERTRVPIRLLIIGTLSDDDKYQSEVLSLIEALGLTNSVVVTGYVTAAAASNYISISDFAVLPTNHGASMRNGSMLAAYQEGIDVLTSKPKYAEFPKLEGLYFFENDSAEEIANSIIAELSRSKRGHACSDLQTWTGVSRAHKELYSDLDMNK